MIQTAIDLFVQQLMDKRAFERDTPLSFTSLDHWIADAKRMEQEQIEEAYNRGKADWTFKNGRQYYNETFKK